MSSVKKQDRTVWTVLGVGFTILLIVLLLSRCGYLTWGDKDGDSIKDSDPFERVENIGEPQGPAAGDSGNGMSEAEQMNKGDVGVEIQEPTASPDINRVEQIEEQLEEIEDEGGTTTEEEEQFNGIEDEHTGPRAFGNAPAPTGTTSGSTPKKVTPNKSIPKQDGNWVNNVLSYSYKFLGTPYEYGSNRNNAKTFDCSDFTRWAYLGALGMDIPKDSRAQDRYVTAHSKYKYTDLSKAKMGDLLFFMSYKGTSKGLYPSSKQVQTVTHVGIYIGGGKMIHTASAPTGVRIQSLKGSHLEYRFIRGGSII